VNLICKCQTSDGDQIERMRQLRRCRLNQTNRPSYVSLGV